MINDKTLADQQAVAWQRRICTETGRWLAWEYFAGAVDYDNDPSKFPTQIERWAAEYRPLYTCPCHCS